MRTTALAATAFLWATITVAAPCGHRGDKYVYMYGDGNTVMSGGANVEDLLVLHHHLSGEFLWVRRGGKSYVIRDSELLDRVQALFVPVRALAPEERAVEREESELDHQIDELEDLERPLTSDEERRLDKLRPRRGEVHRREHELDKREDELNCQAEAKMWPIVEEAIRSGMAQRAN